MADKQVVDLDSNIAEAQPTQGATAEQVIKQDTVGVSTEEAVVQVPTPEQPKPKSIEDLIAAGVSSTPASKPAPAAEVPPPASESTEPLKVPDNGEGDPVPPPEVPAPEPAAEAPAPAAEPAPKEQGDTTIVDFLGGKKTKDNPVDNLDTPGGIDLLYNQVVVGMRSELTKELRKFYKTTDEFEKAQKDEDSFLNRVFMASIYGWKTGVANYFDAVTSAARAAGNELEHQELLGVEGLVDGVPKGIHGHGRHVRGREAAMLLRGKLKGLHRVCLLNSGFWVVLRSPELDELQDIFDSVDVDGQEIGRSIGGHFALIADMFFKKKFTDALINRRMIILSNLSNIYEKGVFYRNLSLHDVDTLFHGLVSLMSRRGLRYQVVCPKCGKISGELNLDISSCKFTNRSMLTPEMIKWWSSTNDEKGNRITRSEADLKRYREEILPAQTGVVKQVIDIGGGEKQTIELKIAVPSVHTYYTVGAKLIEDLNTTITNAANGDESKENLIKRTYEMHSSQLIAPWVQELSLYDGEKKEGQEPEFITDDSDAILEYLDNFTQQNADTDLLEELNNLVAKTRISYFGVCAIECPDCHAVPESKTDSFFPVDIQNIFFGQCWRLLQMGRQ